MTSQYRADIDGLRAIAVLAVVFYHLDSDLLSGGYVGVDVFFVISGYLITSIIAREIDNGEFSITKFYERRCRRILPALFGVIAVTLAVGCVLLDPGSLIQLGKSTAATVLFGSNILFYNEAGYFDSAAELKPLLHTWSLAVEEQYYIFFPLILLAISKFRGRYLYWILFLAVLSLISAAWLIKSNPTAAFYLIHARAWELFVGSLLALGALPVVHHGLVRELLALTGLILIAFAATVFDSGTQFPGITALLPTVGAALIIYAGNEGESVVSRLLSVRPMVAVGLISYSLYLWHWPIIAYIRVYSITEPPTLAYPLALLLMFALAVLSWKFVERPFRHKVLLSRPRSMLVGSALASAALIVISVLIAKGGGLPWRDGGSHYDSLVAQNDNWRVCEGRAARAEELSDLCELGVKNADASFLLWGDSHARALYTGLDQQASTSRASGRYAAKAACPPLLNLERPDRSTSCHAFNQGILKLIADSPQLDTVVLVSRWALYATGTRYKQESGGSVILQAVNSPNSDADNFDLFRLGLKATVAELQLLGKRVIVLAQIPEIGYNVPSSLYVANVSGRDIEGIIAPRLEEFNQRTQLVNAVLEELREDFGMHILWPSEMLCDDQVCHLLERGQPLYRDDNHLSAIGSVWLAEIFSGLL